MASIRRTASRASCTSRTWTSNARRSAQYLGPNVLSGSSYVIAELDGAFTKYYEGTLETEWKNDKAFVRGSYTWSHYYGNFDQDSSGVTNDANVFIGSSNIGDGAGRQLWNNRYGDLRGDRRHLLKLYGYHALPWNATAGIYAVAQSGQPWEAWSYEPYIALTTNTSDTARFAEPAGSRHTPPHWQVDLNYTQNVKFSSRYNVQIVGDLFNVANHQTGLQLPAGGPQLRLQHSAELLRPEEIPAGAEIPVLNCEDTHGQDLHRRTGGRRSTPAVSMSFARGCSGFEVELSGMVLTWPDPPSSRPPVTVSQRSYLEQPLPLDQRSRRRIRPPLCRLDPRLPIGLVQQHADLCALEERHRVVARCGRDAIERRGGIRKPARVEVKHAQLEIV